MDNSQLKEYVGQSLAAGMKPEEVRAALASQGWAPGDIDQALGAPVGTAPALHAATPHRKWPVIVAVVAAALLLGGGAAFAYLKIFAASPDKILAQAVNGAMAAASVEYSGSLRVEMTVDPEKEGGASTGQTLAMFGGEPGEPTKLLLTFDGAYDRLDMDAPKSRGSYTLATTQALGGEPIGTLETRSVGGKTYVSLIKVPEIPLFDLSSLAGVWVELDLKALGGMFGKSATATAEAPKKEEGPTPGQKIEIEKAFIELRPIMVAEKLKDEDIEGTASRHYRLAVDKVKLRAFLLRVQEILGEKDSLKYEKLADDYDKFSEEVDVQALEIWIGKKEGFPTRLLLQAQAKASEDVPGDGSFTLDMTFRNFGRPIAIEAPAGAKTIQEAMEAAMGAIQESPAGMEIVGGAETRADDTQRISEVRQVQTALELGYAETQGYPDGVASVGGLFAKVLCVIDGRSAWARSEAECTGSVIMREVGSGESVGPYAGVAGWYLLEFTLAQGAGSLQAGTHCATPKGIVAGACDQLDTDEDGFKDAAEMGNGYDPNGPGNLP